MSYRIVLEPVADEELEEAYQYKAGYSYEYALTWYFDMLERIDSLKENPLRCPRAPESDRFPEELRHLIYQQYRILFAVRDKTVHVLHVWHGRRDWARP